MAKPKFDVSTHILVPKHTKISEKEKKEMFAKFNIDSPVFLPKISKDDPAIKGLDVKSGDIVKIVRKSLTAGEAVFYRGVTND